MNTRFVKAPSVAVRSATLLIACVAVPASSSAQIRLVPQVGLYAPLADLGTVRSTSAGEAVDIGKKSSTFALGLGLELGNRANAVAFRGNVAYASSSDVPFTSVGCADCESRSTLTALTATLVLRPLPNLIVVQPYFLAGGGVKRYDFKEEDLRAEGLDALVSDQTKGTAHLGVGAEFSLGGLRLLVELSDYLSSFDLDAEGDEELQNDFFLTVGLPLGG